ncbi:MAG: hypothetical protein CVT95_12055 [Bacteroidetes bacterium HGW-Bacteroidetes-12]|nr:MAG: hypothetical protein CVT95_12055 [Bacteroidetes bacterium HGW-Bacteroidetes-12]
MKKLILLIAFLSIAIISIGQIKSKAIIPSNYCVSEQRPMLFTSGDTIVIECDSIYLMNAKRYAFYKSVHEALLQDDDNVYRELLESYELRLTEHQDTYERLFSNLNLSDKITVDLIGSSQQSLASTQKSISNLQEKLDNSIKNLEIANTIIKDERRKSRNQKILTGVGGAGLGFILGVIFMK